jgi:DNA polymerase-3 subunit delta
MESLTFLTRPPKGQPLPIYVLAGDEDFLKRQVLAVLKPWVLGSADSFGFSAYEGKDADFAQVKDELDTLPFLCPRRLVVVDRADPFVTKFRPQLEKYAAQPSAQGVLVLDVHTFPATTRLAKQLTDATITCKAMAAARVPAWCIQWTTARHGQQLTQPAAQLLVDLTGTDMGQLEQELAKLAVYVGPGKRIDVGDVDLLVGRSQTASVFKVFDAIGAGKSAEALAILDDLLGDGEDPFRILGAFSLQLRRLAQVARLLVQKVKMSEALDRAGVPAWPAARQSCEQQLRHLGRQRAEQLFDWLVEIDLGFKGSSQLPPRTQLERLIVRLTGK